MREHATEYGKSGRGLLVELPKGRARQLLEILRQLEGLRRTDRHVGGGSSLSVCNNCHYVIIEERSSGLHAIGDC